MKNLKNIGFLIATLSIVFFTACSSSSGDDPMEPEVIPNKSPALFSANTTETEMNGATIEWTESLDADDDPVTYSVFLEGAKKTSGLSQLSYSLTGLEPETSYTGYVEASDGKGGTSKADFSFTTEPEVIIMTVAIIVQEFLIPTTTNCGDGVTTALGMDAGVLVPKYEGNVTYTVEFGTTTLNSGASTIAPATRTWTNDNWSTYYINDVDAENFFVKDFGAGFSCSNNATIPVVRARYASVSGEAKITIVRRRN